MQSSRQRQQPPWQRQQDGSISAAEAASPTSTISGIGSDSSGSGAVATAALAVAATVAMAAVALQCNGSVSVGAAAATAQVMPQCSISTAGWRAGACLQRAALQEWREWQSVQPCAPVCDSSLRSATPPPGVVAARDALHVICHCVRCGDCCASISDRVRALPCSPRPA